MYILLMDCLLEMPYQPGHWVSSNPLALEYEFDNGRTFLTFY